MNKNEDYSSERLPAATDRSKYRDPQPDPMQRMREILEYQTLNGIPPLRAQRTLWKQGRKSARTRWGGRQENKDL